MDENYQKILGKLSNISGLEKDEIERKVEAKIAKLSGLISKEGAAQVVAAELGISFENEKLKIDELLPGMKRVNVVGKIIEIFPVREYERNGKPGKVVNFVIADDTSNIRAVLWDTNHIELIEKKQVDKDSVVEIFNASMRDNELHLGSFSEFKLSNEVLENVKTEKIVKEKNIFDFRVNDSVKSRAFIVQSFEPRFFYVCPECKKKATLEGDKFVCAEHGNVAGEKRAIVNLVIDDGTETIRAVFFHESIQKLGLTNLENPESLEKQKKDLLGKEMFFFGNVRNNSYFNKIEFIVDDAEEVDVEKLIRELEAK